ncbi:MAG TPA: stage II sporulation protein M [Patescibacteria group bacterium]
MQNLINYYRFLFKDNAQWFKVVLVWFIVTALAGAITFVYYPSLVGKIIAGFQEKFGRSPALDINLALQIFIQNVIASGVALFGGIVLGLGSLFIVAVNGFLIGYIITWLLSNQSASGHSLVLILGGLVPHGILELPAFLIAAAIGLRLGWEWMSENAKNNRWPIFRKNLKLALLSFPAIVLILFIAALIEVFVSGWVVNNL